MKKGLTELVFILDRSGSMSGLEADTIGGYNSMLEKQKKEEGDAIISTVLFDTEISLIHDRADIKKAEPLTDKVYYTKGCTALLDALGGAIDHIGKVHKEMSKEERPEKTLFVITTDGMENSSHIYNYAKVKQMVEKKKKKKGWEFMFLGANIDAIDVAGKFGVSADRAVRYHCDGYGQEKNYSAMSAMISGVRACKSSAEMGCFMTELKSSIEEDYEEYEMYEDMDTDNAVINDEKIEKIRVILPKLNKREQELVDLLYGLSGNAPLGYEEAGSRLNMTGGRARQLEAKILRRIA